MCNHPKYGDGHCAESACPSYVNRCPHHAPSGSKSDACTIYGYDELNPVMTNVTRLYKVTISEPAAADILENSPYQLFFAPDERISPIVFYVSFEDWQAVELAQQPGFTVTRARADWSI